MTLMEKLAVLTDAAKYDAACTSSGITAYRWSWQPGQHDDGRHIATAFQRMGAAFLC